VQRKKQVFSPGVHPPFTGMGRGGVVVVGKAGRAQACLFSTH